VAWYNPFESKPRNIIPSKIIHKNVPTTDNLANVMSTSAARARDVTNPNNSYFQTELTIPYVQLENIYMTTWVGKKIVEIPTDYIFKNGFTFKIPGKPKLEEDCLKFYKERALENRVKLAKMNEYIYGGCIMFPKDKAQDPSKPYNYKLFKGKEDIEFIVRDLSYMAIIPHTEIVSEKYFEPKNISLAGVYLTAENCMLFKGIPAPIRRMPQFRYLGMSQYQNIFQALINDEYIQKGIVNMVYRGNMKYYRLKGLNELVKQKNERLAVERINLIENYASMLSAGILDFEDEVEFVQQSFAQLPEIDERSLARLSAASNIPSMVLLGRSPDSGSLGASKRPDMENFYDYIGKESKKTEPNMKHLFRVIIAILSGEDDVEFEFEFNSPENIDKVTQVATEKSILDNMSAMQNIGLPDDVIKDYAVDKGLLTSEQAEEIDELRNEMLSLTKDDNSENPNNSENEDVEQLEKGDDYITDGGEGSGHFEHAGREGEVGGSLPSGGQGPNKPSKPNYSKTSKAINEITSKIEKITTKKSLSGKTEYIAPEDIDKETKKTLGIKSDERLTKTELDYALTKYKMKEYQKVEKSYLKEFYECDKNKINNFHKQNELDFESMELGVLDRITKINIYKSPSYNRRQSSEYWLGYYKDRPVYIRKSNHWGTFFTNILAGSEEAKALSEKEQNSADEFGRVGQKKHKWDLIGGKEGNQSQVGFIYLDEDTEE